eukprot:scaffold228715_cov28-Tisochrysis_lutea.AAC.1
MVGKRAGLRNARNELTSRSLSNFRNWWGVTKIRSVAPSTAVMISGSATTFSVNLWPLRYLEGNRRAASSHLLRHVLCGLRVDTGGIARMA